MKVDVCVIGAGPAGLTAAELLADRGIKVLVVDESPEPGGRLLGQLHRLGNRNDEFHQDGWWNGRHIAEKLADAAVQAGARLLLGASVWGVFPGWQVCVSGDAPQIIEAERLIIATGATEVVCPIPGWTLPGVMSIGAGQVLATQRRVRPGDTGIVVGLNALSLAISHELQMAGVKVVGVVNMPTGLLSPGNHTPDAVIADLARSAPLAPSPILRRFGRLATNPGIASLVARLQPPRGLNVWGIPVNPRQSITRIHGTSNVEAVTVAQLTSGGSVTRTREVPVDSVFVSGGLRPLNELAAMVGCEFMESDDLGGNVPVLGPALQATVEGVHIAGNATGVESAIVAMAQGRVAAAAIADPSKLEQYQRAVSDARLRAPIEFLPNVARGRETVTLRWRERQKASPYGRKHVAPQTPLSNSLFDLDDELVVCRCEEVSAERIKQAMSEGAHSAEEIKRFTRVGMGACQGRLCGDLLRRIQLSVDGRDSSATPIPGHRPPVRPVPLGELAQLADGSEEWERLHGRLIPSQAFDAQPPP